jgi:YlmC/YmxH family sporulation protein
MFRVSDLRNKDIINSIDGKKLGYVKDIEFDLQEGRIQALILPGERGFFGFFSRSDDLIIDWSQIKKIGVDVIIVEMAAFLPEKTERISRMQKKQQTDIIDPDYDDWQ